MLIVEVLGIWVAVSRNDPRCDRCTDRETRDWSRTELQPECRRLLLVADERYVFSQGRERRRVSPVLTGVHNNRNGRIMQCFSTEILANLDF
jgi:hypothetical protein